MIKSDKPCPTNWVKSMSHVLVYICLYFLHVDGFRQTETCLMKSGDIFYVNEQLLSFKKERN